MTFFLHRGSRSKQGQPGERILVNITSHTYNSYILQAKKACLAESYFLGWPNISKRHLVNVTIEATFGEMTGVIARPARRAPSHEH